MRKAAQKGEQVGSGPPNHGQVAKAASVSDPVSWKSPAAHQDGVWRLHWLSPTLQTACPSSKSAVWTFMNSPPGHSSTSPDGPFQDGRTRG